MENPETIKGALEEWGIPLGGNADIVLEKCVQICSKHNIVSEKLVESWLAYASSNSAELTEDEICKFEREQFANNTETVNVNLSHNNTNLDFGPSSPKGFDSSDEDEQEDDVLKLYGGSNAACKKTPKLEKKPTIEDRLANGVGTPKSTLITSGFSPAAVCKSATYSARGKSGDAILRYKCKDSDYWQDKPECGQPLEIQPAHPTKTLTSQNSFKYMFQKTTDVASTFNSILEDISFDLQNEDKHRIQDLRLTTAEDSWYLGRIRNIEGKLSQGSTCLEGDLEMSGGHVVPLDLDHADNYRFVPGQIVLLKGKNNLGKCLTVTDVANPSKIELAPISLKSYRPLNIIIACGPCTPEDSVQFEALMDLLEVVKRDKPDLLILTGPFFDSSHPLIEEITDTFEHLFKKLVDRIKLVLDNVPTQVVLISSFRDAHHYLVYPTPPYELNHDTSKFFAFPDPSVFEVGGITIGVTSVDILRHLANNELYKTTIHDRMSGLSKLILSQKNFYPLYPPEESMPFDAHLWAKHCRFSKAPHILILPSNLKYFIKEVDGSVVINPEKLTKGKSGGTYARIQVKLPEDTKDNISSVADFCYGEIMKI